MWRLIVVRTHIQALSGRDLPTFGPDGGKEGEADLRHDRPVQLDHWGFKAGIVKFCGWAADDAQNRRKSFVFTPAHEGR